MFLAQALNRMCVRVCLFHSAAEAVMHGHTDSILLFHQQNVPRSKLDQVCVHTHLHIRELKMQLRIQIHLHNPVMLSSKFTTSYKKHVLMSMLC